MIKLFVIFIFIFSINLISSQNPVDFSARCEVYSGSSTCEGYIYDLNSIYVTDTYTQEDAQTEINLLLALYRGTPETCQVSHTIKLMCNQFFQPCYNVTLDGSYQSENIVFLNRRVCNKDCEEGNTDCQQSVSCAGQYDASPAGTIYKFPMIGNTYNLSSFGGPLTYNLECLNVDEFSGSGEIEPSYCYPPLLPRDTSNMAEDINNGYLFLGNLSCLLPCPAPFFSDKQWKIFQDLTVSTGMISLCCVFFNVFTYGVLNKKHDRHSIGILFLSFSLLICMISDIILAAKGWKVSCPEPGRSARQFDVPCAANGILFQYGAVSTVLWWSTMAFDLWLVIKKIQPSVSYVKYYIIFINAIAVIFTIIPIFDKQYGYAMGGFGCWLITDRWQNGVFWIPLTIALILGTSFIVLIIKEIYTIVKNVGSGNKRIFHLNLRPFVIILFIFGEYLYMFAYHFYIQARTDGYYDKIEEYIYCIQLGGKDCKAEALSFSAQFAFILFLRLLGIEVLVFYGINSRTKRIWKASFLANNILSKYMKSKFDSFSTSKNSATTTTNTSSKKQKQSESETISGITSGEAESYDSVGIDSDSDSEEGGGLGAPGISIGRYRSTAINLDNNNNNNITTSSGWTFRNKPTWRPSSSK